MALVLKAMAACLAVGFAAGWIMPFIALPFIAIFIDYFLGLYAGRWLVKFIDYRLENNAGKIIVFGVLIGMCFTPYANLPFVITDILTQSVATPGSTIFSGLTAVAGQLFAPVCFIAGVLRPTLWGGRGY